MIRTTNLTKPSPIPLPTGLITLAFIDLVSSTSLWHNHTTHMKSYRTTYYTFIRHLVSLYNGYEVKSLGDGFFIVFSSATQALDFSLEVQRFLPGEGNVQARIGLHWGVPDDEEMDVVTGRMDYFGRVVAAAERIEGEAKEGGIAVSREVLREVVDEGLVGGLESEEGRSVVLGKRIGGRWCDIEVRNGGVRKLRGCGKKRVFEVALR